MADSVVSQSDDEFEEMQSRRFDDCYSLSADVSESESSTSSGATFSSDHRRDLACNSECLTPPPIMLPVVGGRHVVYPAEKRDTDKPELPEFSGQFPASDSLITEFFDFYVISL